jgi:hypothetical protein
MSCIEKDLPIVVAFSQNLTNVVTGYQVEQNMRRLPSSMVGARHYSDRQKSRADVSSDFVHTILANIGFHRGDLVSLHALEPRIPKDIRPQKDRAPVTQRPYIAILKYDVWRLGRGGGGLIDVRMSPFVTTLSAWKANPGEKVAVNGGRVWRGGERTRLNPYHAICVVQALKHLRELYYHDVAYGAFHDAVDSLEGLYRGSSRYLHR